MKGWPVAEHRNGDSGPQGPQIILTMKGIAAILVPLLISLLTVAMMWGAQQQQLRDTSRRLDVIEAQQRELRTLMIQGLNQRQQFPELGGNQSWQSLTTTSAR